MFHVTAQLGHAPEVEALFLFAIFYAVCAAEINGPFARADGTEDTKFICHVFQPGKFIAHKLQYQPKLPTHLTSRHFLLNVRLQVC